MESRLNRRGKVSPRPDAVVADPVREGQLTLAAVGTAARFARNFGAFTVRGWGLDGLVEPVELVVSELVSNAVQATGFPEAYSLADVGRVNLLRVHLAAAQGAVTVAVWDASASGPVLGAGALDAEGGRGLLVVAALSRRWSWYPVAGGKIVWALVGPAPPTTSAGLPLREAPGVADPCGWDDDGAVLRRVRAGLAQLRSSGPAAAVVAW